MINKKTFAMVISLIFLVGISINVGNGQTSSIIRGKPGSYCIITAPTDGETVSGIVTITVDATSTPSISIDGVKQVDDYSFSWDTTSYADGLHTISAKARGVSDEISVTVANGGSGNNAPIVTITSPSNGDTVSGSIIITVTVDDEDSLTPDIYIDGSFVASATSYNWDTTNYADGSHTIYAEATDSGSLTGSDEISVTVANGGSSGGDGIVRKWALIVGISDYKAISDLSYCDEDATDWYYQLKGLGYTITLLGDSHPSNYPKWDGYATEANVKSALIDIFNSADEDDIVVFTSSGHGSGTSTGPPSSRKQFLCMWDSYAGENGEDGNLYDYELADIMALTVSKTFVFLDHCYSGGMNEMMDNDNAGLIYLTTTCTDNGYGYDVPDYQNGAWTYYFLEYSWQNHFGGSSSVSMEDIFAYASANYPYGGGDAPQEFDGNTGSYFYL